MRKRSIFPALVALSLLLPSCSETRNLAEGETLYVGIREVATRLAKLQVGLPHR